MLLRILYVRRRSLRAAGSSIQLLDFFAQIGPAKSFFNFIPALIQEDTNRIGADVTDHHEVLSWGNATFHKSLTVLHLRLRALLLLPVDKSPFPSEISICLPEALRALANPDLKSRKSSYMIFSAFQIRVAGNFKKRGETAAWAVSPHSVSIKEYTEEPWSAPLRLRGQ